MITEEYLRKSHLFRRLKNGPHGQIVELYAARLVKDEFASSRVTVCSRSLRRYKMADYAGWKQDDDRSSSGKSVRTRCLPETIRHSSSVGICDAMPHPALHRYYDGVRLLGFVHHRLRLLAFPMRACGFLPQVKPEISRFPCKELPHMPGSWTTPGQAGARADAPARVAFRAFDSVGTRDYQAFAARWLACALPYRRFADTLASANARLGADADR
jgi:hypothetical protein